MVVAGKGAPLPRAPVWTWVWLPFSRPDGLLMVVGAALSFAIQWPDRPLFLNIWDSFLFANAAIEYDLLGGYPHPPGYPVFVFVIKVVALFTEPDNALELVSMGFAAGAVALLFGFLREFVSRPAAALAALVFAFSPTLVYNGLMSLSYSAECVGSIGVAWLAWRTRESPTMMRTAALAAVFGLCSGLRTTIFLYLAPLVAWAVWSHAAFLADRMKRFVVAGGVGLVSVLSWLVPMWSFGGGLETWLFTTRVQSDVVVFANTVWTHGAAAVVEQSGRLVVYLEPEFAAVLAMLVVLVAALVGAGSSAPTLLKKAMGFAIVWVGPSLLFMSFVFSGWARGPRGYALVFLPALFVLLGVGLHVFVNTHLPRLRGGRARAGLMILVVSAAVLPMPFLVEEKSELVASDVYERNTWGTGWLGLKEEFLPNETAILTSHEWEFARWYFPEYVVWGHLPGTTHPDWTLADWHFIMQANERRDETPLYGVYREGIPLPEHPIPPGVTRVVLTDFAMAGENRGTRVLEESVEVQEEILPNGWRVLYFDVEPSRPTIESYLLPLGR